MRPTFDASAAQFRCGGISRAHVAAPPAVPFLEVPHGQLRQGTVLSPQYTSSHLVQVYQ